MIKIKIVNRLFELCEQGQFEIVHNEVFWADITSTKKIAGTA